MPSENHTQGAAERKSEAVGFPLDSGHIIGLAYRAQNDFNRRDFFIKEIRDLRYMMKPVVPPPAYKLTSIEVRTPTVNDLISRLVAALVTNPVVFRFPVPMLGAKGEEKASHLEDFCRAFLRRLNKDAGRNLVFKYFDQAVETGEGVIKAVFRPDRWDQKPKKGDKTEHDDHADETDTEYLSRVITYKQSQRTKLPIAVSIVDRKTFYPFRDEDGLARVLEISERTVDEIETELGKDAAAIAKLFVSQPITEEATTFNRKVKLIEYWDREWCAYVIAASIDPTSTLSKGPSPKRELIRAFKHGYGQVPYFSGAGEETSSSDPNYEALSSAFPAVYLAPFLDLMYTMWANIGYLTGFPTGAIETDPSSNAAGINIDEEDSDSASAPLTFEPGKFVELQPGAKVSILEFSRGASAITGMVGEVKNLIQSTHLPTTMQGVPPGDRTAGYAINELTQAAKSKYQRIVENAQIAWSDAFNFILWLIEHKVREEVYVLAEIEDKKTHQTYLEHLCLKPEDINGYYLCEVSIKPRNATDRITEGTFMMNMYQGGAVSMRAVREEGLGYEHPEDMEEEIAYETLMKDPEIQNLMKMKALQKSGMQGVLKDLQAQMQMMNVQAQAAQQQVQQQQGGTNGLAGGLLQPGQPSVTAPTSPMMDVQGMPNQPGMGMAVTQPMPQLPRQYMQKQSGGSGGRVAPRNQGRPQMEGFSSR